MYLNQRRNFLKYSFLGSSVFIMNGCELFSVTTIHDTIKVLHTDLFPKANELQIETSNYISIILHHERVTKEDKIFLKNGVKWLNEASASMYKKTYTKLLFQERQELLHAIVQKEWGESWLHTVMTYLFEAMLGDPIYGGNNNEAGWKWLSFEGGLPRPTKAYL